jgi:hypothetical protein
MPRRRLALAGKFLATSDDEADINKYSATDNNCSSGGIQRSWSVDTLDRHRSPPPSPRGSMSHLPPSLDDAGYTHMDASPQHSSNARRRRRKRRLRAAGSSLALLCGTVVLFGDSPSALLGSLSSRISGETNVKRSLRAVEEHVRQSRRVLRDTVAWERVPRMMLVTDLAAPGAAEEEGLLREAGDGGVAEDDQASESSAATTSSTKITRKRRRMAIVRPFGPNNAAELEESFRLWDTHWPCSTSTEKHSDEFQIDLYLLFSRTFDPAVHPEAVALATEVQNKFDSNNGWNGCFSRLFQFESDIVPADDNYDKSVHSGFNKDGESVEHRDIMWVNGPNESFRKVMTVLGGIDGPTVDGILPASSTNAEGTQVTLNANDAAAKAAADYWSNFDRNEEDASASTSSAAADANGFAEVDGYEVVSIMEPDVRPRRANWLDDIIDEIHAKEPFAVLGR